MTRFPATKNVLTPLSDLRVAPVQILDFGRYTIRIDAQGLYGWFRSEINVGNFTGALEFDGKYFRCDAELPPQVSIALERAGYLNAELYLEMA